MRVVITDLDCSLIDGNQAGFGTVRPALNALQRRSIPLIFIGKRTRAEFAAIQAEIELQHPFVVEDGAAVLLPEDYFPSSILDESWVNQEPYLVKPLGLPYEHLRHVLQSVREQLKADIVGFGDWSQGELSLTFGLSGEKAQLVHEREYSEIFTYTGDRALLEAEIARHHLQLQQLTTTPFKGRWFLTGNADKQAAIDVLLDCYQRHAGPVRSLGLGSYAEDAPWLMQLETVRVLPGVNAEALWTQRKPTWKKAPLPGPAGWNEAVLDWLADTDDQEE